MNAISWGVRQVLQAYRDGLGRNALSTWRKRMEAITAGAIDHDDVEQLATACAEAADKKQVSNTGKWTDTINTWLDRFAEVQADQQSENFKQMCNDFIACGEAADR
jgi:hypothetical protein